MLQLSTAPPHQRGLADLSADAFDALLDLASVMKRHPLAWRSALEGRAVACLLDQPATGSRVSLEVAVNRLGALGVVVQPGEEPLAETARVLSSYCDAIAVCTPRHRDLLELTEHASVPVMNVLTDREDPCRALADCLTLLDIFGDLRGLPIAYLGGSAAVAYSLIEAAMLSGLEVRIAGLRPDPALLARAGGTVRVCESPHEAATDASAVYGDLITPDLLALAAPDAVVMSDGTLDSPRSVTAQQLTNLLPVQQAVLHTLVCGA
jgi:ornithine carbamoyltransferase